MAISFILTIALLGIPFYGHGASSIIIGILVIAALGLYLAPSVQAKIKERWRITARTMNTALLCTMMIVIGYSSYALIVIRSTANTPMDQNSPEDIFTLGEYLGREQYGTRPLFYGPAFSSKVALDVKDGYCIPRQSEAGSKFVRKEKTSPDEKRLLYRTSRTCGIRICTKYVFPAYVQLVTRTTLQAMGRHQRTRRSLRPMRRNGNGEHA